MPGIARLGDLCTGHEDFPPRENIESSSNVLINGKGVHRQGDAWAVHCNHTPTCHASILAAGSSSVFVNGRQIGRIGDPVACGSRIATGSDNVFAGN